MDYCRVPTQLLRRMVTVIADLTLTAFHGHKRKGFGLKEAEALEKEANELIANMGHLMEERVNVTPIADAVAGGRDAYTAAAVVFAGQPNSKERFIGKHPALGMGYGKDGGHGRTPFELHTTVQNELDLVDARIAASMGVGVEVEPILGRREAPETGLDLFVPVHFTDAERNSVLAGLRLLQRFNDNAVISMSNDRALEIAAIRDDSGDSLSNEQIDDLCDEINAGE